MTSTALASRRTALLVWLTVLGVMALLLVSQLRVHANLTAFLPPPETPEQQLLVEQLRTGSGTGLLLAALKPGTAESGNDQGTARELARTSTALAQDLRKENAFARVENGDQTGRQSLQAWVVQNRYHLSPQMRPERFTVAGLHQSLRQRLAELATPADVMVEDLLARDPTGETLAILDAWAGRKPPRRRHGVWFDRAGEQALLLLQTRAPAFDLDAQEAAIARIHDSLEDIQPGARALVSGPGAFGVGIRARTRSEAQWFSALASIALAVLLLLLFRRPAPLLVCGLPLASGILAGLVAVWLFFGGIHGITLAFGITVLGVAIDYPIHYYGHCRGNEPGSAAARRIWPTLLLGVTSTCLAYLAMALSGVDGLAQLGVFTIAGLTTAALAVRWLLPLVVSDAHPPAFHPGKLSERLGNPAGHWLGLTLLAASVGYLAWLPGPMWQNDLSALSPVPADLLATDAKLREAVAAPEPRYLLVVSGPDRETVLQRTERLTPELDSLIARGVLGGYESVTRFLPSKALQRRRLAALPGGDELAGRLAKANADLPFHDGYFRPFIEDAAAARSRGPLDAEDIADSPFAPRLDSLLQDRGKRGWVALLPLQEVNDSSRLSSALEPDALVLDLKASSESMVAEYREQMMLSILLAAIGIVLLSALGLRSVKRLVAVLLPVAITVIMTAAAIRGMQGPLNLFHLISLLLVGGLVLDYALFLNRDEGADGRGRSRDAVVLCSLSTLTVFGILACSGVPVLRAIGSTVATGVISGVVVASLHAANRDQGTAR